MRLFSYNEDTKNVSYEVTPLFTGDIPSNALNTIGDSIHAKYIIHVQGGLSELGSALILQAHFGGTVLSQSASRYDTPASRYDTPVAGLDWEVEVEVMRVSKSKVRWSCRMVLQETLVSTNAEGEADVFLWAGEIDGLVFDAPLNIKVTGQGPENDEFIGKFGFVDLIEA